MDRIGDTCRGRRGRRWGVGDLSAGRAGAAALAVALALGGACGAEVSTAAAAEVAQARGMGGETRPFTIAPQPLNAALLAFSEATGIQFFFGSAIASGTTSPGVSGDYTASEALDRLLAGTGLTWRFTNPRTVTLEAATPAGEDVVSLDPITVEGSGESARGPVEGYAASRSATATKTDTPILETPASVQVVPRDVVEDQAALNLKDVYENVSGVQQAGNTLNARSEVLPFIRGFESPTLLRNGMRATEAGAVDLVNVERVEVLKGPASMLYGALDPGGIVNIVTKRPRHDAEAAVAMEAGSYGHRRVTADVTGPVGGVDGLAVRLNAARTDSDSFRDHMYLKRTAIAPSLLWETPGTELLVDLSYIRERQPYDTGVPVGFDSEKLVSDDTFFNDPDLDGRSIEGWHAATQLAHEFNEVWAIRHQFQLHRAISSNEAVRPRGLVGTPGAEMLRLRYQNEDKTDDEVQTTLDLTADFDALGVGHKVLLGAELLYQQEDFRRFRQNLPNVAVSDDPDVDVVPPASQPQQVMLSETQQAAVYAQNQLSLLEDGRLKLLLGGRFDIVHQNSSTDFVPDGEVDDEAFTGRAGLLYQLGGGLAIYTSASQSFQPQEPGTLDAGGTPLDPERGVQYEAGVKAGFLGEKLIATASVFQVEKEDVAVFDSDLFNATGQIAYFPGVRQRSRGFEADVSGAVSDQIDVIASYAYTDSEVLESLGEPETVGERLGNVPLHSLRLWATYRFDEGSTLEGWRVGGGARYVSENTAQFDDDVKLDAYTVFDLAAWYVMTIDDERSLRFQLNIDNLFDTEYYARASDRSIVHPGAPRTVIGSVALRF